MVELFFSFHLLIIYGFKEKVFKIYHYIFYLRVIFIWNAASLSMQCEQQWNVFQIDQRSFECILVFTKIFQKFLYRYDTLHLSFVSKINTLWRNMVRYVPLSQSFNFIDPYHRSFMHVCFFNNQSFHSLHWTSTYSRRIHLAVALSLLVVHLRRFYHRGTRLLDRNPITLTHDAEKWSIKHN